MSDKQTSAIFVIAAISVIIFSAVGVGVMTGLIPNSLSKSTEPQLVANQPATAAAPEKETAGAAARKTQASNAPQRTTNEPARVASAPSACANCGKVEAVNVVEQQGEGSGLGAVAGGVAGGVLGNQIGQGRGRTAATVAGAGAGAYAGHEIEKRLKKTERYDVVVRLEDGTSRIFPYETQPAFRPGDRVKIVDGTLTAH